MIISSLFIKRWECVFTFPGTNLQNKYGKSLELGRCCKIGWVVIFLVTIKGTFCSIHKRSIVKIANVYWVQQPRQDFYYLRGFLISRRELCPIVYFPFLLKENEEDRTLLKRFLFFPKHWYFTKWNGQLGTLWQKGFPKTLGISDF